MQKIKHKLQSDKLNSLTKKVNKLSKMMDVLVKIHKDNLGILYYHNLPSVYTQNNNK